MSHPLVKEKLAMEQIKILPNINKLPDINQLKDIFVENVSNDENFEKSDYIFSFGNFNVWIFTQIWGSTALGFNGFGGQTITSATTTVICDVFTDWWGVFFGDSLAYIIHEPNELFKKDVLNQQMQPVYKKGVYLKNPSNK